MDPESLKRHVTRVCDDLERGRRLRRPSFALAPGVVALLVGTAQGCGPGVLYPDTGGPSPELCNNDIDDDRDGRTDCDDPDCDERPACADVPLYGDAMEDCTNEIDDDGDDLVDCDDPDCDADPACTVDAYRAS